MIGRSTFDLQPVFETLAENAVRLCGADRAVIFRADGPLLRIVSAYNMSAELRTFHEQHPITAGRGSCVGRVVLERRTIHIHDAQADPEYTFGARDVDPLRTLVGVPMLRAGELLGAINVYRLEVLPFTESQIALLETFADQAAIAIENARLLTELQTKNADLTEALEQQTATARSCASSARSPTNIQPVLDTVAKSAARFCGADDAEIFIRSEESLQVAAHHGPVGSPRRPRGSRSCAGASRAARCSSGGPFTCWICRPRCTTSRWAASWLESSATGRPWSLRCCGKERPWARSTSAAPRRVRSRTSRSSC